MLIVCPTCATSYDVELASLQPSGRQVRCVRCRAVWHAAPRRADKLLAAAEAIGPEPQVAHAPAGAFAEEPALQPADEQIADGGAWAAPDELPAAEPAAAEMDTDEPVAAVEVEAPSIAPVDLDDGQPPIEVEATAEADPEPLEDIETYAARRNKRGFRRPSLHWPLSNLQSGILALIIVDAILVGWRNDVVRILPQTASFYSMLGLPVNLRGLALDGVTTTTEQHEGVPILVVEGSVVNDTPQDRRRAAAEIRGPQLSQRGNLFLDRRAAARDLAARRSRVVPQPSRLAANRRARRAGAFRHPPRHHRRNTVTAKT